MARNELNKRNSQFSEKGSLIQQLHSNQEYIISIRDSLNQLVLSHEDKITPTNYLVYEGRANIIKAQAKQVLNDYPKWNQRLHSIAKIVDSCKGHEVDWDVYCFKDMPYFGVEPILNVWINQYDQALNEIMTNK